MKAQMIWLLELLGQLAGGDQAVGGGGALPGQAEVCGEAAGEVQLGVGGDQPGLPAGADHLPKSQEESNIQHPYTIC